MNRVAWRHRLRKLCCAKAVAGFAAACAVACPAPARAAAPAPGDYEAQLCVQPADAAEPHCGPAQVRMRSSGQLRVRVDDIVYQIQLQRGRADVVLFHGAMQVDDFSGAGAWTGRQLRFTDAGRQLRYDVRFPPPAPR